MINKLSQFLGKYKKFVYLIFLVVLVDVSLELSIPLLMARVVDIGIPSGDIPFIIRNGIYMILLALAAIVLGITNMHLSTTTSMGFGANLRDALYEKIQDFSFNNIDRFSTASLITRLTNDVNNIQLTVMMTLRMLMRFPMMMVISFILAYNINAQLSIVLAVAMPLLTIGVLVIMRTAFARFTYMQEKIDALNNVLQENLIGIRVVKAYVREDHEIDKFSTANDVLTAAAIRAISLAILNMPVMTLVLNAATLAIIWFGGLKVNSGIMGTGELISFLSYVMHILMSVMMISMVFIMGSRAKASGNRIVEVLETQTDIIEPAQPRITTTSPRQVESITGQKNGSVEFRDVCFKYNHGGSGENVLEGISFKVRSGQVVGIIGGTGTGKTTLVHLIPRLYDVCAGAVLVDGVDVRDYQVEALREKIGVVLQNNTLFSGTIRENLLWGNQDATQDEIVEACTNAQAHDFIMSFPDGYDTMLGQGGVNVSGGQKQRLCIARAMVKKPDILILDDSTSAVDSTTESYIRKSFYQNLAGTTVFIIAQRISSVRDADQIIILDDGRIAGSGTHKELLATSPIYQEINASQQEVAFIHG